MCQYPRQSQAKGCRKPRARSISKICRTQTKTKTSKTSSDFQVRQENYGGKARPKRKVFRRFLNILADSADRTDTGRAFQRTGAHALEDRSPVLVLTLETDRRQPWLVRSERVGRALVRRLWR